MGVHSRVAKMKVVCLLALLVACVSAGPRPDKRDAEIAEFGITDTIKDAIKGKIMDVIRDQLTEENVEKVVDMIKEKIDGGKWVDMVIDYLSDLVNTGCPRQRHRLH